MLPPRTRNRRALLCLLAAPLFLVTTTARAGIVAGGGPRATDCLTVFDVPAALTQRRWTCTDGDACDSDGEINGRCVFPVSLCANSSFDPRCTLRGVAAIRVEHAADNGDPLFDPGFQALQSRADSQLDPPTAASDTCTTPSGITVAVQGPFANGRCDAGRKVLRVSARSEFVLGVSRTDSDTLRLDCQPAPGSCTPTIVFDSTFERIQAQVFAASCALGGCHDSEGMSGGLLLESGASLTSLVGVDPQNATARARVWKRITQTVPPDLAGEGGAGDPAASFLFAKLAGALEPGLGSPMPLGKPRVQPSLVEIIRLWIEAGAPRNGWVAGTDQ